MCVYIYIYIYVLGGTVYRPPLISRYSTSLATFALVCGIAYALSTRRLWPAAVRTCAAASRRAACGAFLGVVASLMVDLVLLKRRA